MSVNSFNEPTTYKGRDEIALSLLRLLLLEPGTNNARPEMGVGIVSKYRFSIDDDLEALKNDIRNQISTYLPQYTLQNIALQLRQKVLHITIQVNDDYYGYNLDGETRILALSDINNV